MRLQDNLEYYARIHPDAFFAEAGGRAITYDEANREANRLANLLISEGLKVGDRFAYLSKNSLEMSVLYHAAGKAGAVPVPLNYRLAPAEWAYIINDAGSKLLFAHKDLVPAVNTVRADLKTVGNCYAIATTPPEGWIDYARAVGRQDDTNIADRGVTRESALYQMYTSGTTGRPKGAILTHNNILSNLEQMRNVISTRMTLGDRVLVAAPMYHAAGTMVGLHGLHSGAGLVIHEDFVPTDVVEALSNQHITSTVLVPAMIQACLTMVPDVGTRDYPALKAMVYGASPIAEETLRNAMQTFKCDFYQAFGMTETTSSVVYLNAQDHRRALKDKPGLLLAAGRAIPGTDIRIVDENGEDVAYGEVGEIIARGPQIMQGYWNMPEATADALRDGWMHTGDAAAMDKDGYLFIQDRIKDMIVSGGENVYPREVENALFEHPSIIDAAVFGIPGAKFGEDVMATIVVKPGETLSEKEVIDFCRTKLGGYKIPRKVDFMEALPRNASGKVLKKDLREPYWKGHTRRVS
ncbi:MAG: long-chain-fatty-acid--CoA ligase [Parvibaculum sp.]